MKYRTLAVIINLAATVLLTMLVTTGIYVTTIKHYVGRFSTNSYPVIRLDTTYWNVGCTIVGTAIGHTCRGRVRCAERVLNAARVGCRARRDCDVPAAAYNQARW
jgi:hypothetical protein